MEIIKRTSTYKIWMTKDAEGRKRYAATSIDDLHEPQAIHFSQKAALQEFRGTKSRFIIRARNSQGALLAEYSLNSVSEKAALARARRQHHREWVRDSGVSFSIDLCS